MCRIQGNNKGNRIGKYATRDSMGAIILKEIDTVMSFSLSTYYKF